VDGTSPNKAPTRINLLFSILNPRSLTDSSIRAAQTCVVGPNGKHTDGRGASLPQAEAAPLPPPCKKVEVVWRAGILHC
jgi:hypothetical protein